MAFHLQFNEFNIIHRVISDDGSVVDSIKEGALHSVTVKINLSVVDMMYKLS